MTGVIQKSESAIYCEKGKTTAIAGRRRGQDLPRSRPSGYTKVTETRILVMIGRSEKHQSAGEKEQQTERGPHGFRF